MINVGIALAGTWVLPRVLPFWPLSIAGWQRRMRPPNPVAWPRHAALACLLIPSALSIDILIFALLAAALCLFDLRYQILPDSLTFAVLLCGILRLLAGTGPSLQDAAFGAVLGGGLLWLVRAAFLHLRGVEALGLGDVKLAAGLGVWVGALSVGWVVMGAALLGLAAAHVTKRDRIAFGPALLIAAWSLLMTQHLGVWPIGPYEVSL